MEPGQPPLWVLRLINPIVSALLRSPLHRLLSKQFILLTVTGRKSGRTYRIPVGRHESNGTLTVAAAGAWRHNLRGGATFRVTVDGREHEVHAELEEQPDRVAQVYKTMLDQLGPKRARDLGLKVNVDRMLTVEEIEPVVAGRAIATIRLQPD